MDEWGKMKAMCLHELGMREVVIPARWKTAVIYDSLIEDGTAKPIVNVNPFMKGYAITAAGMDRLKELADERQ